MLGRLGQVLYWMSCILAGLITAGAIAVLFGTEKAFRLLSPWRH